MGHRLKNVLLLVCTGGFVLCMVMSGTFAWDSGQQALNDVFGQKSKIIPVELIKLDKDTETPVAGTDFYLFRENGEQIGGRYVTDSDGKIQLELNAGSYYFEEAAPAPGYTYDTDESGTQITRYPFSVTEDQELVTVKAYNRRQAGTLVIRKRLENANGDPLTQLQEQMQFTFTVSFSDGGTYPYAIDGGEKTDFTSGGTIRLTHGQSACLRICSLAFCTMWWSRTFRRNTSSNPQDTEETLRRHSRLRPLSTAIRIPLPLREPVPSPSPRKSWVRVRIRVKNSPLLPSLVVWWRSLP